MKKFVAILLMWVISILVFADQASLSKDAFRLRSESLAYEMGKTFQLAKNCGQDMPNISVSRATALFMNYYRKHEVKVIMAHYKFSASQEKGKSCNRRNVEFHRLMQKMGTYIRLAAPFSKNINRPSHQE